MKIFLILLGVIPVSIYIGMVLMTAFFIANPTECFLLGSP